MVAPERIKVLQDRIARHDDQLAYRELFTSLYSFLFHFACSLVKAKQPAEDIVSDVFIRVWEKRKDLQDVMNLKVYLYVSVKNSAINYLNRQKQLLSDDIENFRDQFMSIYFNPEQLMITADMVGMIQAAIDELPSRCKIIFKLVKEDNLRYREVAGILGISEKTVENQVAIAVRRIAAAVNFDLSKSIPSPVVS